MVRLELVELVELHSELVVLVEHAERLWERAELVELAFFKFKVLFWGLRWWL